MHCRTGLDDVFLIGNLNQSWFKVDYRTRRRELLWEREQAKLPEAMEAIEREQEADRLVAEAGLIRKRILELKKQVRELDREEAALLQVAERVRGGETRKRAAKTAFLVGCSWHDCRGYLNEDYTCKLCERKTCRKCLSPEEESHECDPDAVSTAALLRKETKPCPGCGEGIQKISGCDQMWCLSCHTAFSWKTGALERGVVHNPEYYRWRRENGGDLPRQPGDEPCGGPVGFGRLLRGINQATGGAEKRELIKELSEAHQLIQHVTAVELPTAQAAIRACQDTLAIRVQYLKGEIDASVAASQVEKADRLRQRHTRALDAWQLVSTVGQDLLRGLAEDLETQPNPEPTEILGTFFDQLSRLGELANGALADSVKGTGAKAQHIARQGEHWRILRKDLGSGRTQLAWVVRALPRF